jgi:uncharacterized protein DUF4190/uncharacterized protein DUF4339
MNYHLEIDNKPAGPFTEQQIIDMLKAGKVNEKTRCWREGDPGWGVVGQFVTASGAVVPLLAAAPPPVAALPPQPSQTSGLAIASLVLGLAGFCTAGLAAIPGIICGHLSLSQIKRSAGKIGGQGMAIVGLILGYLGLLVLVPLYVALALPAVSAARSRAKEITCTQNARQIGMAILQYASDNDDTTPPDIESLYPKYTPTRLIFISPFATDHEHPSYELLFKGASLSKIASPSTTILVQCKYTSPAHKRTVIYADFHVESRREPRP